MKRPTTVADFERARRRWSVLGWQEIPKGDEPAIKAAWIAHLQPAVEVVVPKPCRFWQRISVADLGERAPEIEADFTLKVLAAFRRCARPGERLLAIDWQHPWYYFDPHADITAATRDEWAMPVLPDGDSYNYVAPDFRFGSLTDWDQNWSVSLFGAELLAAFAADPPQRFLWACGPGQAKVAEP
jgi:hypothetical protein